MEFYTTCRLNVDDYNRPYYSGLLFRTFESACAYLEKEVKELCDDYEIEFTAPSIEDLERNSVLYENGVLYYKINIPSCDYYVFTIEKMKVMDRI